jgi:4-aminobutyrate aminotransferase-like enzyme
VLYDYQGDFPPGTVGTFFALEGKEIGKDIMFASKPDGQYMVIDREIGEENRHRVLTLHLARIR